MNKLLENAKRAADWEKTLMSGEDSGLLFRFSPIRKNLIEWYAFAKGASALVLGEDSGMLGELLSEKGLCVAAPEAVKEGEIFDYVVWVGADVTAETLSRVKRCLKPQGALLLAAENRYGLKYLAGAVHERTGKRFDGVQGCSREGLLQAAEEAGFAEVSFYYPMPDYRLPSEIYSDRCLPKPGALREKTPNYDADQVVLCDEVAAFDRACEDGLFPMLASSFLVVCAPQTSPVAYARYNATRRPCFRTATYLLEEDGRRRIQKKALGDEAKPHISRMKSNYSALRDAYRGVSVLPYEEADDGSLLFSFVSGESLFPPIGTAAFDKDALVAALSEALAVVLDMTPENRVEFFMTEEFAARFPDCNPGAVEAFRISNIDSVFSNFVRNEAGIWCLDYEWVSDFPVPVEYIAYRALLYVYKENAGYLQGQGYDRDAFLRWFIASDESIALYDKMEYAFQQYVHGEKVCYIYPERYKKRIDTIENMQQGLALKEQHIRNLEAENQALRDKLDELHRAIKNPLYGAKLAVKKIRKRD